MSLTVTSPCPPRSSQQSTCLLAQWIWTCIVVSICVWLLSLNTIYLRFSNSVRVAIATLCTYFHFIGLFWCSISLIYLPWEATFTYTSMWGHRFSFLLGRRLGVFFLGYMVSTFWTTAKLFFKVATPFCTPTSHLWMIRFLCILTNTRYCFSFSPILYVCVLPTCMTVHHMYAWCPWDPTVDIRSPVTGVLDGYEPPNCCWKLNPGLLEE